LEGFGFGSLSFKPGQVGGLFSFASASLTDAAEGDKAE
jgi:hypothetical protein